jgi:polar amino acid transport system permease protein
MSDANQVSGPISGMKGQVRRFNIGGMPGVPVALLGSALLGAALAIATALWTVLTIRAALIGSAADGWWVSVGTVLLALISLLVASPLARALARCQELRQAAKRGDIVTARQARAEASAQSWITLGYTLAQLIAVIVLQFVVANNLAVAKTFFSLPLIIKTFPLVLTAFWVNVKIFLLAEALVLIWGLLVALAMFAPGAAGKPLRLIATAYVDIFRSLPAILVIYLIGFGLPLTGVPILKDLSLITYVVIALTITVGAYVAEIYRAGIQSIHWSQTAAARSLGLSHMQTLRFVVVPQGIRHIIPPLLNAFIALQKDTALVSVVGVIDSFNQSMVIAANYYNLSAATTVSLLFILISIPQTRIVERMAQRDRARMRA